MLIEAGRARFAFENEDFAPFQMAEHSEYLIFGVAIGAYRGFYKAKK